jgi:hypothetical protein
MHSRPAVSGVYHVFIAPIHVGDGNRAFPNDIRLELALQDERAFATAQLPALPVINNRAT